MRGGKLKESSPGWGFSPFLLLLSRLPPPVTIPNLLSLLRMGLTPLFLVAVVSGRPLEALLVFGLAGVTDGIDGFIARRFGQQSRLGAYLDPAADKLLLTSAYVVLAIPGLHAGALIPAWVTVLVIARDVIIVVVILTLALALDMSGFEPTLLSKLNTTVQVVTALRALARVLQRASPPPSCVSSLEANPSPSREALCASAAACRLLAEAADCLPDAGVSGREAADWIRRTAALLPS